MCSAVRRRRSSPVTSRLGRRGGAAVAGEAGADERLVGQVVAREERGDALEERGLGDRAGGRQEAVHGPFHAVRERDRGGLAVRPLAEPPPAGLDLLDTALVRPAELLVDQGDHALHRVARRARPGERAAAGERARRDRSRRPGRARPRRPPAEHARAGLERRAFVGLRLALLVDGVRGEQPAQLAGAVEADEDLAEQPLVAGRLATRPEHLDGRVHDRRRGLARRERPGFDMLRRREQARSGDELRIARDRPAAASSGRLLRVRGPGRQHPARAAPARRRRRPRRRDR